MISFAFDYDTASRCQYLNLPTELAELFRIEPEWVFCVGLYDDQPLINFTRKADGITVMIAVGDDVPAWFIYKTNVYESLAPKKSIAEGTKGGEWSDFILALNVARAAALQGMREALT